MLQDHDRFSIHHVHRSAAIAIEFHNVPFTRRFFRLWILYTVSSLRRFLVEQKQLSLGIVNVISRIFQRSYFKRATGNTPVVATIAFLELKFL